MNAMGPSMTLTDREETLEKGKVGIEQQQRYIPIPYGRTHSSQ